jgi:hypothetical protein
MNERQADFKPIWNLTHTVKDEETGLAVEISTSQGRFNDTLYSFRIGRILMNSDTKQSLFIPHIRAVRNRKNLATVELQVPFASVLSDLLIAAQQWIVSEMALKHEADIEKRIEKETKSANFGKKETKRTGKTEKNRNKHKAVGA